MTTGVLVARSRSRSRPWLLGGLASLLILAVGWSALWLFARREAARAMDAWFGAEAAHGRIWACPDRAIGGYPLGLRVTCAHASFSGRLGGEDVTAVVAGLDASVMLYQPRAVTARLAGPLTLQRAGVPDLSAAWSDLEVEVRLLTDGRVRAALAADALEITPADGAPGLARHAELHFAPAANRPAEQRAYEVWLDLLDARLPAVDALVGGADPLSLQERGVLTAVDPAPFAPWPLPLEAWRAAGGILDLASLSVAKGSLKLEASGQLGLDDEHRLAGRLRASLAGIEPVASRLGLPPRLMSMGGALAGLLAGTSARTAAGEPPTPLPLPLVLKEGRLWVGPFKSGLRLDPLY